MSGSRGSKLTLFGKGWLIGQVHRLTGVEYMICGKEFALRGNPDEKLSEDEMLELWAGELTERRERSKKAFAGTPLGQEHHSPIAPQEQTGGKKDG